MKKSCYIFVVSVLCVALLLSIPVEAADFVSIVDECDSAQSTQTRTTYNLVDASSYFQASPNLPVEDTSALAVKDYTEYGEIVYSVLNVEEINLSTYRVSYPTFAVRYQDGTIEYGVMPDEERDYELLPLWLDEATDYVYCEVGGQYLLLYDGYFAEGPEPQGELVPYGIDVQQSTDGETFHSVEVDRMGVEYYSDDYVGVFEENFSAGISPSSRYIKVRIKQFSRYPVYGSPDGILQKANLAMIRQVQYEQPSITLNQGGGAEIPPQYQQGGSLEEMTEGWPWYWWILSQDVEELQQEQQENEDKKEEGSSSKSTSSSSKSSGSSGGSSGTSSATESSTSTSTSDSNNTTTTNNYTTNYFIMGDSPQTKEFLEQTLGVQLNENAQGSEQAEPEDAKETAEESEQPAQQVLYQDDVTVGSSSQGVFGSQDGTTSQPVLMVVSFLSGMLLLEIIRVVQSLRSHSKTKSSQEDDGSI